MTREEVKAALRRLTNEATDDASIEIIDSIVNGWPEPGDTQVYEERITSLETELSSTRDELEKEKERFRKRFWDGEDDNAGGDGEGPAATGADMQTVRMTDSELADLWRD